MSQSQDTDRAFLLRSVDYGESDRIITLFLDGRGKVSALARGARKSWRRFGGALEPFSLFEVALARGKGRLWHLKQAHLLTPHADFALDLKRMEAGAFILNLVREASVEGEPLPEVFSIIEATMALLETANPDHIRPIAICTELKILTAIGLGVSIDHCNACGRIVPEGKSVRFHPARGGVVCTPCGGGPIGLPAPTMQTLARLNQTALSNVTSIGATPDTLDQIETALSAFTAHHLGWPKER
ncbi:MAG: DNA repair protein RecO [Myxococcota bacterium]|nr:DNA repair protein RecO [Myxococcota bacterium]